MTSVKHIGMHRHSEKGIALILVLLVISALTVLVLNLNYTTRVHLHLAENFRDETKAYFLALGAVEGAMYWLKDDLKNGSTYDALCEPGDLSCDNEWSLDNPGMEVGDGFVEFKIRDENGKIWINNTTLAALFFDPPGTNLPVFLERLEKELALDDLEVFASIQDWLDKDSDTFQDGAEDDYYDSLDPSYTSRNGPLLDLSELLMVKGINDKIYFGDDEDSTVGLKDVFTIFGDSATTKINVNTAPDEVLAALGTNIDVEDIVQDRPFINIQAFNGLHGNSVDSIVKTTLIDVKSSYFSVYIQVRLHKLGEKWKVNKYFHAVLKRDANNVSIRHWREE